MREPRRGTRQWSKSIHQSLLDLQYVRLANGPEEASSNSTPLYCNIILADNSSNDAADDNINNDNIDKKQQQ